MLLPDGPELVNVPHPKLGAISVRKRTPPSPDFPHLVWFTSRTAILRCRSEARLSDMLGLSCPRSDNCFRFCRLAGCLQRALESRNWSASDVSNLFHWRRIALGFPLSDVAVVRWRDHRGYYTDYGRHLTVSAVAAGDDPDDWFVSEQPVDVMRLTEYWASPSPWKPRLERIRGYVPEVRKMVSMCRAARTAGEEICIPPPWMNTGNET